MPTQKLTSEIINAAIEGFEGQRNGSMVKLLSSGKR